jgi:O-methyltransferase
MGLRRQIANFLIKGCGLRKLHNTTAQKLIRSILDEIDLQHFRDIHPCRSFDCRLEMYRYVQESLIGDDPVDYLEFGVFRGESIRCWTDLNRHKDSRFYGFDSFEGLPEDWRNGQRKGHFNIEGNMPNLDDPRVKFVKGWFDKIVPPFVREFAVKNRLVMHLDADLYGSTMLPLLYLSPLMTKGSLLILDEFYDREHEFKAFTDWQNIYRRNFQIVAEVDNYAKICAQLE